MTTDEAIEILYRMEGLTAYSGERGGLAVEKAAEALRKIGKGTPGRVFTNTDPMNLYVEREDWADLLGQFDNGQRVRIILVKEDAE